jgi:glutamate-1-semialdehyde 2,1-aminomutase
VPWAVYGTFSAFHVFTNPRNRDVKPTAFDPFDHPIEDLRNNRLGIVAKLRMAMLLGGVDITGWPGGTNTAVHTDDDLERTVAAFREAVVMLKREGEL